MQPRAVLETVLYVDDLDAARRFYEGVLGLECTYAEKGRHLFFRLADHMLLIFDPSATLVPPGPGSLPVPAHGAHGAGHVCFRASENEIVMWLEHLAAENIVVEADFIWPQGGRSIYFRDPAGNSIEFAEPRIWGLP